MMEPKGTLVEVWVVGADDESISLLSDGDAWRTPDVVRHGHRSWDEAKWLLRDVPDVVALHQTSTRDGNDSADVFVHTYVAVVALDDYAEVDWPAAKPIRLPLLKDAGQQARVGAVDEPQPTYLHVLEHGIRHYAFLWKHDTAIREALGERWGRHLGDLEDELAAMFIDEPADREAA